VKTRTAKATLAAALCLSASAALPASAPAHGGTAAPEPGAASRSGDVAPQGAAAGSLRAARGALLGRRQRISGHLDTARAGTTVLVQRRDPAAGWITVATARARSGGAFAAAWKADRMGRVTLRAIASGVATAASATAPTARMTVYGAAIATHFGPGFYGTRTACGTILTRATVGVAHKTLPCGTLIEFYYRGRTVRAPVVDRGPYANNAAWDLTMPASQALQFNGKDYVGAIAVGRVALKPAR
jgi:rare lipoprotein A